ncbi:hypothetical protein V6Z12_D02G009400 [Gossypium hirsutum]
MPLSGHASHRGSKLEGLSHDRRGPAPDLIGKAIHKAGKGARICVSS